MTETIGWIVAALMVIAAFAGAYFVWRRHYRHRIDELERRVSELARQLEESTAPRPELELSPELKNIIAAEVLEKVEAEAEAQAEIDPGRPTADFTDRLKNLLDRTTAELLEYQAMSKHAISFVRANLDEGISVAKLAKAIHTSPRTLQRALKQCLHCSPTEIILAVKMHEAKQLLKKGTCNVSQAGYEVGFDSPDHFSRRFKTYYGVPPSAMMPIRQENEAA